MVEETMKVYVTIYSKRINCSDVEIRVWNSYDSARIYVEEIIFDKHDEFDTEPTNDRWNLYDQDYRSGILHQGEVRIEAHDLTT
jgi:hypothetical protein